MVEKIAQDWLKDNHENNKSNVKEIKVDGRHDNIELKGEIKFEGYSSLEVVELVGTKGLTKVTFDNKCTAIREISVYGNEITEIDGLDGLTELRELKYNDNKLTKIDVSKNTKLVVFRYHENPPLKGENIKGLGNLASIVRLTGGAGASDGIALDLSLISREELENVAKELSIDTKGKSLDNIRQLIKDGINGLKDANKDVADAITRLGVTDLKITTLDAKLGGGTSLKDIPTTLKDLLEKIKKLEDALKDSGMNPDAADLTQQIGKLKGDAKKWEATEKVIKQEEGKEYWQSFEAQVLIEAKK